MLKNLNYDVKGKSECESDSEATRKPPENYPETTRKTSEKILEAIKQNGNISKRELAEMVGITVDGVKYHIQKLKAQGVIERIGADRGGFWKVKDEK